VPKARAAPIMLENALRPDEKIELAKKLKEFK